MPNDQFAILMQGILMLLTGIVATVAGFVYVKTDGKMGGFVCFVFAIITLSIGGDVLTAVQALS